MMPINPVPMNAHCQPQVFASHGTTAGASTAPIFVPALTNPKANARSFFGNHSDSVFVAAGKFGDSETPRKTLMMPNPHALFATTCKIDEILHAISAHPYPSRTP